VRRSKGHSQSVIRTGKLTVNLDAKTVEVDSARVHLTGKEYAMLELLSLRKGTTLTKEMFLNHLYGGMTSRNSRSSTSSSASSARSWRMPAAGQLYRDGLGPRLCAARSRRAAEAA